jgi:hypothetical protein
MTRQRTSRALSPAAVALTLTLAVAATSTVEVYALRAKERAENPPQRIDAAYCTKCHSDAKSLAKMRLKEGKSHLLFNADGTLRDPAFAAHHAASTSYGLPYPK